MNQWRRVRAGYYVPVDSGSDVVSVVANPVGDGGGWVVIYTDGEISEPQQTLAEAKALA